MRFDDLPERDVSVDADLDERPLRPVPHGEPPPHRASSPLPALPLPSGTGPAVFLPWGFVSRVLRRGCPRIIDNRAPSHRSSPSGLSVGGLLGSRARSPGSAPLPERRLRMGGGYRPPPPAWPPAPAPGPAPVSGTQWILRGSPPARRSLPLRSRRSGSARCRRQAACPSPARRAPHGLPTLRTPARRTPPRSPGGQASVVPCGVGKRVTPSSRAPLQGRRPIIGSRSAGRTFPGHRAPRHVSPSPPGRNGRDSLQAAGAGTFAPGAGPETLDGSCGAVPGGVKPGPTIGAPCRRIGSAPALTTTLPGAGWSARFRRRQSTAAGTAPGVPTP